MNTNQDSTQTLSSQTAQVFIHSLTDAHLFHFCKTYGSQTLRWRQKFTGLLPEVFKRKLFERKGFGSIFEFAKKMAGLSEEQVRRVLNLERKFENMPALKELLVSGEVSVNKLVRVASIASSENETFLATNVQVLSKSAVETLVRDKKLEEKFRNENGLIEALFEAKSVPGHTMMVGGASLRLSTEVHSKLLELQQKGFDINQLLTEFLDKRKTEIAQRKAQIRQQILQKEEILQAHNREPGRHTPLAAEKILLEEFGTKCAVRNCQKLSAEIHHILPFSVGKTHDPNLLAPLCKEHHELAHTASISYKEIKLLNIHR